MNAKTGGAIINFGYGERTPLHFAVQYNSKEMFKLLLLKGADINEVDITYFNLLMSFLIKLILHKERIFNNNNETLLHYAAYYNCIELGKILISKGTNINAKDIIYLNIKILFLIKLILK